MVLEHLANHMEKNKTWIPTLLLIQKQNPASSKI